MSFFITTINKFRKVKVLLSTVTNYHSIDEMDTSPFEISCICETKEETHRAYSVLDHLGEGLEVSCV